MKVKTISVLRSRTINLGNFESSRLEFSASAELEDGDDYDTCHLELDKRVRLQMRDAVRRIEAILEKKAAAEAAAD